MPNYSLFKLLSSFIFLYYIWSFVIFKILILIYKIISHISTFLILKLIITKYIIIF
jgi:hypothetical protein